MSPIGGIVVLAFGAICILVFFGLRAQAEQARGDRRFYVIGFYRSVLLALGVVSVMIGLSRVLTVFTA